MDDPEITSTKSARVRAVVALHRPRGRRDAGRYLVEGQHPVAEAFADGVVEDIYVTAEGPWDIAWSDIATFVSPHVMAKMSDATTAQGVIAVARWSPASLDDVVGRGWLLVCENMGDPGNLGTTIRTADALGAAGVVVTAGSVDPTNPKVVRASAGSLTHVPIVTGVTVEEIAAACRAAGQRLVGLAGEGEQAIDADGLLRGPVAIIAGSEAHGLSMEARAVVDALAHVPQPGRAESLNVAAATAIAAWVASRANP